MKRLNPETGKPFKCGDIREDGRIFRGYNHANRGVNKAGYFYEIWETEETFYKRQTERKLQSRAHRASPKGRPAHMLGNCRGSAKRRNIYFNLTVNDIAPAVEAGHCQLTGLPFDFNPPKDKGFNPYAPSVDRIDSTKGYVAGNVRVVLWAVNSALSESSDEDMLPILKAMVQAIEKNVKQKSTTSISAGTNQQSEADSKRRAILAARLGEDRDDAHHHCGADARKDVDHRAQEGSGDGVGHRGQEVVALEAFTRIENNGDSGAEIIRLEFGRRYLSD